MEHLNEVLLNPVLNHLGVLSWLRVPDLGLNGLLDFVLVQELLPVFRDTDVEVHQNRVVVLLHVGVDIRVADDAVDLG